MVTLLWWSVMIFVSSCSVFSVDPGLPMVVGRES